MQTRIEKKPAFAVAGLKKLCKDNSECPLLWQELMQKHSLESLVALGSGKSYGACLGMEGECSLYYMAAFDVQNREKAKQLGLEVLEVPEAEYLVLDLKGAIPKCIHEGFAYAMGEYLPKNGYVHAYHPDFEVYTTGEGDMYAEEYQMELWIPIQKA